MKNDFYALVCDDTIIFCFLDFSYTSGLATVLVNQFSTCFSNGFISHEQERSSVDKNDSLNGFNLRDEVVVLLASFIFIGKLIHKLTKFDCSI